jgi:hypothetical protein
MYRQQKKVATSITIALKHCLKKTWWVPPAIWLGPPLFNLLIAACIGDIVPHFGHTVLLSCWFQNPNIFLGYLCFQISTNIWGFWTY